MDILRGVVHIVGVEIFTQMIAVVVEVVWVLLMGGLCCIPQHLWLEMSKNIVMIS